MATANTDYSKIAHTLKTPYQGQDVHEVAEMIRAMETATKNSPKNRGKVHIKKTTFNIKNSADGAVAVHSWRMNDWDYKKGDLPTYARGLFTTRNRRNEPEIVVRGYDKFFNVGEVHETEWENILTRTSGPYFVTLKHNGCIIFISGLEDETLLVCSKHSTGDRGDIEVSHSTAGERWVEKQLAAIGKTKADLARELRSRNVTAVAELCDDSFEEHILDYPPEIAGLYLHGMNLNLPQFTTYPCPLVQKFAEDWGFRKTGLIMMDDIHEVRKFLEEAAETGAHGGRDVEGFVIRCRESYDPAKRPYRDWFFKYKFEEPYLMYRQWRECTKGMISGKPKPIRKHKNITEEYLTFARKRLQANPKLKKEYLNNHGIISLRNDFLAFKNMDGSDAAKLEEMFGEGNPEADAKISKDVILAPIATIGCGKTTIGLALCNLFGWGHIQNDNITGKGRPPRFVRALLQELQTQPAVFADRNNALKHERRQLLADAKAQYVGVVVVALNFVHNEDTLDEIRRITRERIIARGDNHQTIHAATDQEKFIGVMEGFINRFEECTPLTSPDSEFDAVINLDPVAGSRKNLEVVIDELHKRYPLFLPKVPSAEEMDAAFQYALDYKPNLRHDIPDRSANMNQNSGKGKGKQYQPPAQPKKPKSIEYISVDVPTNDINTVLKKAFQGLNPEESRFFTQLEKTRRVQPKFHVTLMHRATAKDRPELWEKYTNLQKAAFEKTGVPDGPLGECGVLLERVVYDDRIMAIVVRLVDRTGTWETVNKVAHITVGTRDDTVKPKESNDLLTKWLEEGVGGEIKEVVFANKVDIKGIVRAVMSR